MDLNHLDYRILNKWIFFKKKGLFNEIVVASTKEVIVLGVAFTMIYEITEF